MNLLFTLMFAALIIPLFSCQTIHKNDKEAKKQEEILTSQKSLIINYLNKGVPNLALKELRRLMVLHPKDPDFANLMGLTQLALEQPNKAAEYFKKSFKVYPRTSVALNLSSAYIEAERYGRAIKLLNRVRKSKIAKNYQHPERIYHNIGLAAERADDLQLAKKNYELALSENPNYYLSLMRLGQLYQQQKKSLKARKTFAKAKEACPKCFDPINALAMGFIAKGKYRVAFLSLKQFIRNPDVTDEDKAKAKKMMTVVRKLAKARKPQDKGNIARLKNKPKGTSLLDKSLKL